MNCVVAIRMPPVSSITTKQAAFGVLQARVDRLAGPGDDSRAQAVGYWSLAHGLAVLFLDGRVRDELEGSVDEIIQRVASATLRFAQIAGPSPLIEDAAVDRPPRPPSP